MTDAADDRESAADTEKSSLLCRICCDGGSEEAPLVAPCICRGSMKYVHPRCLLDWLESSKNNKCEICKYAFKFQKVYEADTPQRLPVGCILRSVRGHLRRYIRHFIGLLLVTGRLAIAVLFNTLFSSALFSSIFERSSAAFLVSGIFLTLVNSLHSHLFHLVTKVSQGRSAVRINTRQTLESLATDHLTRTASFTSYTAVSRAEESVDENSSEQSSDDLIDNPNSIALNLTSLVFSVSATTVTSELFRLLSLVWLSVLLLAAYSLVVCALSLGSVVCRHAALVFHVARLFGASGASSLARLCRALTETTRADRLYRTMCLDSQAVPAKICSAFGEAILHRRICVFTEFLVKYFRIDGIRSFLVSVHLWMSFLALFLLVSYQLKRRLASQPIRAFYHFFKMYTLSFVLSIYSFGLIGMCSHIAICFFINGSEIFPASGSALFFLLTFTLIGLALTKMVKDLKEEVIKKFRPGLIYNPYADERMGSVIRRTLSFSYSFFLRRYFLNIFKIIFYIVLSVRIQAQFCPPLLSIGPVHLKLVFLYAAVSKEFTVCMSNVFNRLIRLLTGVCGLRSFFYNEPVRIRDRGNLVWDMNVNADPSVHSEELRLANEILRASLREAPEAAEPSEESQPQQQPGGCRSSRRHAVYAFTERRLRKYFGNSHSGRFSLFYRPRATGLLGLLIFVACFASLQVVLAALLCLARYTSRFLSDGSSTAFSLSFLLLARGFSFLINERPCRCLFSRILKRGIIHVYTNVVVPTAGTLLFFSVHYRGVRYVAPSSVWLRINLFSSLVHASISLLLLSASIDSQSYGHLISFLGSYLLLKIVFIVLLLSYSRYLGLRFFVYLLTSALALRHLLQFAALLYSGNILERIREECYLKEKRVLDYQPAEERTAA